MQSRRNQRVRRRFEAKLLVEQLKSGPCKDCKDSFHPCQMDLLHRERGGRPVATLILRSKARILEEARKCDLVCANCARLRVWNESRKGRGE